MSLPFDKDPHGKRHQCFCCGRQYGSYDEMRQHIVESHEEGRDYVLCPFEHCKFPVRDVRAHARAKHKNLALPKTGQMRATLWRDFSGNRRKTKKPKFKEGYYQSTKMNKPMHYRSGYEADIYECLDHDVEVTGYEVEPFEIPYVHKGKAHKYIPDLIVHFLDGHTECWEVKPANQTMAEVNQNKWHAAAEACKQKGWVFEVKTEIGIQKLKDRVRAQAKLGQGFFGESDVPDDEE